MRLLKDYRDATEEAEAEALVAKVKATKVEEAAKATKAKVEKALSKSYKETKSLQAKARVAECEVSNTKAQI